MSQHVNKPNTGEMQLTDIYRWCEFVGLQSHHMLAVEIPCSVRVLQSHVVDIKPLIMVSEQAGCSGGWALALPEPRSPSWDWHSHLSLAASVLCCLLRDINPWDSHCTAGLIRHLQENNTAGKKRRVLRLFFSIPRFHVLQLSKGIWRFIENSYLVWNS